MMLTAFIVLVLVPVFWSLSTLSVLYAKNLGF